MRTEPVDIKISVRPNFGTRKKVSSIDCKRRMQRDQSKLDDGMAECQPETAEVDAIDFDIYIFFSQSFAAESRWKIYWLRLSTGPNSKKPIAGSIGHDTFDIVQRKFFVAVRLFFVHKTDLLIEKNPFAGMEYVLNRSIENRQHS